MTLLGLRRMVPLLGAASLAWMTTACRPRPPVGDDGDAPLATEAVELLVPFDAETLDPRFAVDVIGVRVSRIVHAGLVELDPDTLLPSPSLAKSWRWLDALTLELDLRDDVRFHSGAQFEADDVVATLESFDSSAVLPRIGRILEPVERVDRVGPHQVRIHLRRPHVTLLTDLELPILRRDQAKSAPSPDGALDGLGPFRIGGRAFGEIRLVPADTGLVPRPRHPVVVRAVRDENARALRFHAGSSDVTVNGFSPILLPVFAGHRDLEVRARPGANVTYLLMRNDQGPFRDARLREALSLVVDRPLVARTLLGGHAEPTGTLLPTGHWATPPGIEVEGVDKQRARSLVREVAGSPDGRIRVVYLTSTDRVRMSIARFVAQEASEIGLDLEVTPLELGTLLARLNAGEFDAAMLQLPELTEPNVFRVFAHSASIPPAGANRARIRDGEIDDLLDRGDRTTDLDERRRIYARFEARMREGHFLVPLWHEDQVSITSARARSFVPSAEGRWRSLAFLP
ncbi:MAG: ABC transporter substrate-binding protein [Polyangiaceae bacterium]